MQERLLLSYCSLFWVTWSNVLRTVPVEGLDADQLARLADEFFSLHFGLWKPCFLGWVRSCDRLVVKPIDVLGDIVQAAFDSEVACLEPVHLCVRQNLQIGFSPFSGKEKVVLCPEDDRLW